MSGPQTSECTLIAYPDMAIDHNAGLYGVPDRPDRPGTLQDMKDGPGMVGLNAICPFIFQEKASVIGPKNVQLQLFRDEKINLDNLELGPNK